MSDAVSLVTEQEIWRPAANPWLIAVTVSMAAFMEVLDTAIANVALPHIGGNLGASNDQSTWVLTSYLVANAIVLPITGWLAGEFFRAQAILHDVHGYFHCQLPALWNRSQPWLFVAISRAPGCRRRGSPANGAGDSGRYFSTLQARPGIFDLRHYRGLCACDRANLGRVAYR